MWSPHQYRSEAKQKGLDDATIEAAVAQIEAVELGEVELPSLLSLNHLAVRARVPYQFLRGVVQRSDYDTYRKFSIRKRSGGRRFIHVPAPSLSHVQKWINKFILNLVPVHRCSYAFAPGSSIVSCASRHCGAQWLIKMDITGFFESVSEIQAYRVFKELGYQPLVAFELARIVTIRPANKSSRYHNPVWRIRQWNQAIWPYTNIVLGYLPQGAPTSPMLSNLVMKSLDEKISNIAKTEGLTYTRYSDDLTFSTSDKNFGRARSLAFIRAVGKVLSAEGFQPQHRKTKIIPPGSRKIVLGLNVDGTAPRLRREFKDNLRLHIHYLEKFGPTEHAKVRGFDTIWGMKAHLRGLIDFAKMIEPEYASKTLQRFEQIDWPF